MDITYQTNIAKVTKLLQSPKNIVILSHKNPDGDAIGSCTGLYHFLTSINHNVSVIIPNDIPDFLLWLPGSEKITIFKHQEAKATSLLNNAEIIFYLDFNSTSRIENMYKKIDKSGVTGIMIDHHPHPDEFADIVFSDTSASATAELVYWIIRDVQMDVSLTTEIASGLFVGIMTDTGCFAYNSSNPETFSIVSKLIQTGINKDEIYSKVYDNYSYQRMRLLGNCLRNKLDYFPEYRTGIISITQDELHEFEFKIGDTEGFVNYPLTIKDVVFSALFIEKKDMVKISFRSKGTFPVNKFSSNHFNGGGHLNAAGGESSDNLANVLHRFKSLLEEYKDELLKS